MKNNKKVSGIYVIKCIANGKIYLGSSVDIARRWSSHLSQLKNDKHPNKQMQEDFNKYGWDRFSFRIKTECLQRELYEQEAKYLARYNKDTLYNVKRVLNTQKKIRRGKEAANYREKWSAKNLGENNPNVKYKVEQIIEVKTMLRDGVDLQTIADKFGMSSGYVSQIKNGYKWASVKLEDEM